MVRCCWITGLQWWSNLAASGTVTPTCKGTMWRGKEFHCKQFALITFLKEKEKTDCIYLVTWLVRDLAGRRPLWRCLVNEEENCIGWKLLTISYFALVLKATEREWASDTRANSLARITFFPSVTLYHWFLLILPLYGFACFKVTSSPSA